MSEFEKTAKREGLWASPQTSKTGHSLKSQPEPPLILEREDWTRLRTLSGVAEVACVTPGDLPRLIAKELVDNSCDAAGDAAGVCKVGLLPDGGMYVEDEGPGIAGGAEGVAGLFCVRRPGRSTKYFRLPTRGCLGSGLRIVAGGVLATGGRMVVATMGKRYRLHFNFDDGATTAKQAGAYAKRGSRIEVWLGEGPWSAGGFDSEAMKLARRAIAFAVPGQTYKGRSSAHWYDSDSFYDLVRLAGTLTVRELATHFEGCSAGTGEVSRWRGCACSKLSEDEAEELLAALRASSKEVQAARLGCVGKVDGFPRGYAKTTGILIVNPSRTSLSARIPFAVEAWAKPSSTDSVEVNINRTPTIAPVSVQRQPEKTKLGVFGCGLKHAFVVGRAPVAIWVNITTPHMPIITASKEPNLFTMLDELMDVVEKAARCARRIYRSGGGRGDTEKVRIEASLDEAVKQASGDGQFEFSIRQLFYVVRPMVADGNKELAYKNFSTVVGAYETEHGPLPGMYRDPRGTLYHPHLQQEIPLGTRAADGYERPVWTFNKVLYVEKEGVVSVLRQARWPERHDCALMSSKGFASRAARDVLDLLGETDEELLFFCVHDADAAGTMIYQALQEETMARPAREVKIVDLGLQPWEGIAMGLPVESPERKGRQPVARYVSERDDGAEWVEWLQHDRIELNAMTTPQLIAWLDRKMEEHGRGRLVPPAEALADHLGQRVRARVADTVRDAILTENNFTDRVAAECGRLAPHLRREVGGLPQVVRNTLEQQGHADLSWANVVDDVAGRLAGGKVPRDSEFERTAFP
jgi:hypothetical protein